VTVPCIFRVKIILIKKGELEMKRSRTVFTTAIVIIAALFTITLVPMHVSAAEKTDVHWLMLSDQTGPYSAIQSTALKAGKFIIKWINESDYIPGANIIIDYYDHGAEISKAVSAYQIAVAKKPRPILSNGGMASHTSLAIKPLAKRTRIPNIDGSSARNVMRPQGWAFSFAGSYEGSIGAAGDWILANWKSDSKYAWIRKNYENRKPRFAIIGWDNAFGRGFDKKEGRDYLKSRGVDFVGSEYIPVSPSDTTAQVLRLVKEKKADFIYFGMFPASHAAILKDAHRLGLRDKFQDIAFSSDSILLVQKYAKELVEGSMQLTHFQSIPSQFKEPLKSMFKKSGLPDEFAGLFMNAVLYYDTYSEVTRRAIKQVGIENLNGQAIYDALINMKAFSPMGFHGKMSFSKTKRSGADNIAMYQIQNGKLVLVEELLDLPDLLPGGKDVVK
jgi:ABC-type branched-subunit amino acid transport system substrate-binding protein